MRPAVDAAHRVEDVGADARRVRHAGALALALDSLRKRYGVSDSKSEVTRAGAAMHARTTLWHFAAQSLL